MRLIILFFVVDEPIGWAFSATSQVESQYFLGSGIPLELSSQQIASCVTNDDECCDGCGGGDTVAAYSYLLDSKTLGLAPSAYWPYEQSLVPSGECGDMSCTKNCNTHDLNELTEDSFYIGPYAKITGYEYATKPCFGSCQDQDLATLAKNLQDAPVSICLNAANW